MSHTPTVQQIDNMLTVLRKALPFARREGQLRMDVPTVNSRSSDGKVEYAVCGTIHCVGGWFAVVACNLTKHLDYMDGARAMAKVLGFSDPLALCTWATGDPSTWGNYYGRTMFGSAAAYSHPTKRPNGAHFLQHVVDHWEEVRERIRTTQKHVDITQELAKLPPDEKADTIPIPHEVAV